MVALRRACRAVGATCRVVPPLERDVSLAGAHQRQNAALAVAAARTLLRDLGQAAVDTGLGRIHWPGRFEVIDDVVLDGAHNGASANALAATLRACASGRRTGLVVGINRDKDARAVVRPLLELADRVWATQTANNVRALTAADLGRLCQGLGADVVVEPDVTRAIRQSREASDLTCVTGSLMLVGQARESLGLPVPEALW
jgi:dihydrofolate synthase/folylpolyglutamate synthase